MGMRLGVSEREREREWGYGCGSVCCVKKL